MMTGEGTNPAPAPAAEKPATEKPKEEAKPVKERSALRWIGYGVLAFIIIVVIAYLSIGVVFSAAPAAASYPYTTTYQVNFPASQMVNIGNSEIIAIPTGDQVTLSINKETSIMNAGETRTIQERRATISILFMKILDFDFKIDATYRGRSGDSTQFYLAFRTSEQVPSFLISRLLPASVQARPV